MMDWTGGHGWMGFGWIFMVLFWVLVLAGVLAILRWLFPGGNAGRDESRLREPGEPREKPLDILKARYARGEIEQEEYERKRRELEE